MLILLTYCGVLELVESAARTNVFTGKVFISTSGGHRRSAYTQMQTYFMHCKLVLTGLGVSSHA